MSAFYLDYPCALIGMRPIYNYDPYIIEGKPIPKDQVLGLEAPLWTERVAENSHVERLVFPRLLALAENCWTAGKDFADFMQRAEVYTEYLKGQGVAVTPIAESDPHGAEGACMAGAQIVEVAAGFTQALKDKQQRGKTMRNLGGILLGGFLKRSGYSQDEQALARESMEKAIRDMGL